MSIHGGTWRVHASAVDDIELISSAMIWMVGGDEGISINSYKSAHGGRMATIIAKMNRKSALFSLKRFGNEQLGMMAEEIREKIDEDKVLHVRASLSKLVSGEACLENNGSEPIVMGAFKLEVYPNEDVESVAKKLLRDLSDDN